MWRRLLGRLWSYRVWRGGPMLVQSALNLELRSFMRQALTANVRISGSPCGGTHASGGKRSTNVSARGNGVVLMPCCRSLAEHKQRGIACSQARWRHVFLTLSMRSIPVVSPSKGTTPNSCTGAPQTRKRLKSQKSGHGWLGAMAHKSNPYKKAGWRRWRRCGRVWASG